MPIPLLLRVGIPGTHLLAVPLPIFEVQVTLPISYSQHPKPLLCCAQLKYKQLQ